MKLVYSYSFLDTFHNVCPRQAKGKFVTRTLRGSTVAADAGIALHRAMEHRIKEDIPLPPALTKAEPFIAALKARENVIIETEVKLGLNEDNHATGFFSSGPDGSVYNPWLRGVPDVIAFQRPNALLTDWKTGKPRDNWLQHAISAVLVFCHFTKIDKIRAFNFYTRTGETSDPKTFTRDDKPALTAQIKKLALEVEQAATDDRFPARPSPLCAWCVDFECQHNRNKERPL